MRIIVAFNKLLSLLFLFFLSFDLKAQNQNTMISQDLKFEELLNEKRKINSSLSINDSYKIQIFTGGSENAKKILNEFKQEFPLIDATIVFNTPNYKVWVGNFRSRIEAEKILVDINNRYKNVLLIKPR